MNAAGWGSGSNGTGLLELDRIVEDRVTLNDVVNVGLQVSGNSKRNSRVWSNGDL